MAALSGRHVLLPGTMSIGAGTGYGRRAPPAMLQFAAPFVVILITDLVRPQLPGSDNLVAVFGFSPREAETALLLARGCRSPN
jgi:hypothetical protein